MNSEEAKGKTQDGGGSSSSSSEDNGPPMLDVTARVVNGKEEFVGAIKGSTSKFREAEGQVKALAKELVNVLNLTRRRRRNEPAQLAVLTLIAADARTWFFNPDLSKDEARFGQPQIQGHPKPIDLDLLAQRMVHAPGKYLTVAYDLASFFDRCNIVYYLVCEKLLFTPPSIDSIEAVAATVLGPHSFTVTRYMLVVNLLGSRRRLQLSRQPIPTEVAPKQPPQQRRPLVATDDEEDDTTSEDYPDDGEETAQ